MAMHAHLIHVLGPGLQDLCVTCAVIRCMACLTANDLGSDTTTALLKLALLQGLDRHTEASLEAMTAVDPAKR